MPDTARERLAALLADTCDQLVHRQADAILNALRLTDAAALALMEGEAVVMPKRLTAENGMKYALSGEFSETFESTDFDGDQCFSSVPVSWTNIKAIYAAAVAASPYKDNSDAE